MNPQLARVQTAATVIIAVIAASVALTQARDVLIPFVLAVFLTYIFSPIMYTLEGRLKFPHGLALHSSLIIGFLVLGFTLALVAINLRDLLGSAEIYREKLLAFASSTMIWLQNYNIVLDEHAVEEAVRNLPIFGAFQKIAGSVVKTLSSGVLVVIFLMFLLSGRKPPTKKQGIYAQIDMMIRRYLVTKVITSGVTAILVGITLTVLGVELALMFAILAFLLNFIPTLGSIIATLAPLPIVLFQFESYTPMILAIAVPTGIQMIIGNVIEPKLLGRSLDLHPAMILLSLVFWGFLWGTVGMILAVPIMAVVKIALERIEGAKAVSEIMAGRLPKTK